MGTWAEAMLGAGITPRAQATETPAKSYLDLAPIKHALFSNVGIGFLKTSVPVGSEAAQCFESLQALGVEANIAGLCMVVSSDTSPGRINYLVNTNGLENAIGALPTNNPLKFALMDVSAFFNQKAKTASKDGVGV